MLSFRVLLTTSCLTITSIAPEDMEMEDLNYYYANYSRSGALFSCPEVLVSDIAIQDI